MTSAKAQESQPGETASHPAREASTAPLWGGLRMGSAARVGKLLRQKDWLRQR